MERADYIYDNIASFAEELFEVELASYQKDVVECIFYKEHERLLLIWATQSGKTFAVDIGVALTAALSKDEQILIIAPTREQAHIHMRNLANFLSLPFFAPLFDFEKHSIKRIKDELSKNRITFKNGSEIRILGVGGSSKGEQALGHSATILIIDESASIADEVYKEKILRILGAEVGKKKVLVEIGTPHRINHFYDSHESGMYHIIKVDDKLAIKEGRLRPEFLKEQRETLGPTLYNIWYGAEFPDETDDSVFSRQMIDDTIKRYSEFQKLFLVPASNKRVLLGVDVARFGSDKTVLSSVENIGEKWFVKDITSYSDRDTMKTCAAIHVQDDKFRYNRVKIDDLGLGGGVVDRLKELGFGKATPVIASSRPNDRRTFLNVKSEMIWNLRNLMERGLIAIPDHDILRNELRKFRYEMQSDKKIKIIDPEDKSPDFTDSLALACYERGGGMSVSSVGI